MYVNVGKVYDYYKKIFNCNFFDDKGVKFILIVYVGESWNNVVWNGV